MQPPAEDPWKNLFTPQTNHFVDGGKALALGDQGHTSQSSATLNTQGPGYFGRRGSILPFSIVSY